MFAPPLVPQSLWDEELRNHCECARPRQLLDGIGIAMGAYFLWDGIEDRNPLATAIAAIMIYIHGERFLVGDQINCCAVCGTGSNPVPGPSGPSLGGRLRPLAGALGLVRMLQ